MGDRGSPTILPRMMRVVGRARLSGVQFPAPPLFFPEMEGIGMKKMNFKEIGRDVSISLPVSEEELESLIRSPDGDPELFREVLDRFFEDWEGKDIQLTDYDTIHNTITVRWV